MPSNEATTRFGLTNDDTDAVLLAGVDHGGELGLVTMLGSELVRDGLIVCVQGVGEQGSCGG